MYKTGGVHWSQGREWKKAPNLCGYTVGRDGGQGAFMCRDRKKAKEQQARIVVKPTHRIWEPFIRQKNDGERRSREARPSSIIHKDLKTKQQRIADRLRTMRDVPRPW